MSICCFEMLNAVEVNWTCACVQVILPNDIIYYTKHVLDCACVEVILLELCYTLLY